MIEGNAGGYYFRYKFAETAEKCFRFLQLSKDTKLTRHKLAYVIRRASFRRIRCGFLFIQVFL
jgi:hypothetical protein